MHPNPIFRKTENDHSIAFVRARSFGVLSINAENGPLISHVPFLLSDDTQTVDLHLVRSNPIARALPAQAVIAVQGPDSYISPDWYGVDDQVPTWNYVAVHLRGQLELRPQEELHALLDRQSAHFETQLSPKKPWTSDKMSEGVMERMMRAIVPVRLHVTEMHSTWKLNQNKTDDARLRAAEHVSTFGIGTDLGQLSDWMASPPDQGMSG
ncbi:FMN-binding negative transcriptional regulator [Shimia ponticola]|uniref:FMN-binding negative transcriptional regulator n=1 Tax=Shimia ponticola TaxID=2582893 RepID=UPI0011BF1032|nr:FMN-binding negative transcriptional regulator [Shimia ponticola]